MYPFSHTETVGEGHQLPHNPDKAGKENGWICDCPLLYLWNLQKWSNHFKSVFSTLYPHAHIWISVNNPGKHKSIQRHIQKPPYSIHIWNIKASILANCELKKNIWPGFWLSVCSFIRSGLNLVPFLSTPSVKNTHRWPHCWRLGHRPSEQLKAAIQWKENHTQRCCSHVLSSLKTSVFWPAFASLL